MELDAFFLKRITQISAAIRETTYNIKNLKDKLGHEKDEYIKCTTSFREFNWNIFNSYLNCMYLEELIENENKRLVYMYSSGLKLIIKCLKKNEKRLFVTTASKIKVFINDLYDDNNISDNIYILLPDLIDLEFTIETTVNRNLMLSILQKIRFLQDVALKRRIR